MSEREAPPSRDAFRAFERIDTRWADDDVYGHVNNVAYYAFFDTAVNRRLIERGVLDPKGGETIGLVIESRCRYFAPLSFPDRVDAGLRVEKLGNSSVTYAIGLFRAGEAAAAAEGRFVHVYVDRLTRRPVSISAATRAVLEELL